MAAPGCTPREGARRAARGASLALRATVGGGPRLGDCGSRDAGAFFVEPRGAPQATARRDTRRRTAVHARPTQALASPASAGTLPALHAAVRRAAHRSDRRQPVCGAARLVGD